MTKTRRSRHGAFFCARRTTAYDRFLTTVLRIAILPLPCLNAQASQSVRETSTDLPSPSSPMRSPTSRTRSPRRMWARTRPPWLWGGLVGQRVGRPARQTSARDKDGRSPRRLLARDGLRKARNEGKRPNRSVRRWRGCGILSWGRLSRRHGWQWARRLEGRRLLWLNRKWKGKPRKP